MGYPASRIVCKRARALHHYHAFGLRIASELELPELHRGEGPADVTIRYRPSDDPPLMTGDFWLDVSPGRVSNRLEDIQFTVTDGDTVLVETYPSTPAEDIRVWLLGSVMAAVLHQRDYLPIHANVIALAHDSAAAFAGQSGAGKSTLAGWFEARGRRVLTDDLCAIRLGPDDVPKLYEGIPRLKLWSDALSQFGRSEAGLEKVSSGLDKFHVPTGGSRRIGSLEPLRLERIYLLDKAEDGADFRIVPLQGAEAATEVLANAFRWQLGQRIQAPRAQFDQCLSLARHARVFRIERRWGFDHFEGDCVEIERHLEMPLEETPAT